jgi:hypothetical protein
VVCLWYANQGLAVFMFMLFADAEIEVALKREADEGW